MSEPTDEELAGEWGRALRNLLAAILLALEQADGDPRLIESGRNTLRELEDRLRAAVWAEAESYGAEYRKDSDGDVERLREALKQARTLIDSEVDNATEAALNADRAAAVLDAALGSTPEEEA
jgi:hypothetical protein